MTVYRAVVKVPVEADKATQKRELVNGLSDIAMELVAEHDYTPEQIERALEDAYSEAEYEYQLKQEREEQEDE